MLPYSKQTISDDDINAVMKVLKSQNLTQGPEIEKFEKSIQDYCNCKYAVAVSSATAGLHLVTTALDLKTGNKLITSPISFVTSANVAKYCNADVLFSSIDENVNMCTKSINTLIENEKNIKIIIPVHFAGSPCDMSVIDSLANKYDINVVEDAAHALGGSYACGSKIGSCKYSKATVFSFHAVKPITMGEGGVITTNDEDLYKKLLRLRSHGINKSDDKFINKDNAFTDGKINPWYYEMTELGYHYRITDIQCALGNSQLKSIDKFQQAKLKIAVYYDKLIKDIKHIKPIQIESREISGHHLYVLRINFKKIGIKRNQLIEKLKEKGIGTQVHYIPIYKQPYYKQEQVCSSLLDFKIVESYYDECLSIPFYPTIETHEQDYIISSIEEVINNYNHI